MLRVALLLPWATALLACASSAPANYGGVRLHRRVGWRDVETATELPPGHEHMGEARVVCTVEELDEQRNIFNAFTEKSCPGASASLRKAAAKVGGTVIYDRECERNDAKGTMVCHAQVGGPIDQESWPSKAAEQ
jgi:hypothetical protein